MATQRPQSASTPLDGQLSGGRGAPTVPAWLAPSSERLGARLVSSGVFLVLLTTLAMTWISFSVPGCWSELKVREPRGVEVVVRDREVPATGVIREDCDIPVGCLRADPIDGRFEVNGTAAVAALLAAVVAGVGLVFVNGAVSFRLRAAVALSGALLMAVVAWSPEAMLRMSWEGTPARPDAGAGAGPVIGAGLFVAIVFVNVVAGFWERARGRRMALLFLADAGFGVVCGAVALLALGGPAILVLIPVLPPLAVFAGGLHRHTDGSGEPPAEGAVQAGSRSRVRWFAFGVFAVLTTLVTAGIALVLSWLVVFGIAVAGDQVDTTATPGGIATPTPIVATPTWTVPTPTRAGGTSVTATGTATATATTTSTPAPSPVATTLVKGAVAVVANLGGTDLRVRKGPGLQYAQVGSLNEGDRVTLISSRVVDDAGAYLWWQVQLASGLIGWAAEGPADGSQRWLVAPGAASTPTPTTAAATPTPVPPTPTRTGTRTATPTPTRTATATPTSSPSAGPFRIEGRASTPDGAGVIGVDVAILKGAFRVRGRVVHRIRARSRDLPRHGRRRDVRPE